MREILFKAKRIYNGEWIIGSLIKTKNDYYICEKPYECMDEYSSLNGQSYGFGGFKFVDQSTICQFTGLTDKNGQKIWENDIVSFTHSKITSESLAEELGFPYFEKKEYKRNYAIEFVNTYCTYGLRFRSKSIHFPCKASTLRMHDCVVIGNIIDNPELLNE